MITREKIKGLEAQLGEYRISNRLGTFDKDNLGNAPALLYHEGWAELIYDDVISLAKRLGVLPKNYQAA